MSFYYINKLNFWPFFVIKDENFQSEKIIAFVLSNIAIELGPLSVG